MNNSFYLPILKSKQGEFDGLSKLDNKIKPFVSPMFELTGLTWDNTIGSTPKTIYNHLDNFCSKIEKSWPFDHWFIDTQLADPHMEAGKSCIEYIHDQLQPKRIAPIPVIKMSVTEDIVAGIDSIALFYGLPEVGIRLTIADITSQDFERDLNAVLNKIQFRPHQCHLILDLANSDFSNIEDFTDGIIDILSDFPQLKLWKSFTVCGGSFPATNLIKTGEHTIPRNDWKFFKRLKAKLEMKPFNRPINYGDYSIVAPGHFDFDFRKMKRSANIRYTHNETWYVIKGGALQKSEDYKQYVSQATRIYESEHYLGESFSKGDHHIKKCKMGEITPGSPAVWKWVGNNHHITKVVMDLFSIPLAA